MLNRPADLLVPFSLLLFPAASRKAKSSADHDERQRPLMRLLSQLVQAQVPLKRAQVRNGSICKPRRGSRLLSPAGHALQYRVQPEPLTCTL